MNEKQRLEKVLAWVNKVRKKCFGAPPIKHIQIGETCNAASCPIHNSFVGARHIIVGSFSTDIDNITIRHPAYVRKFIRDFDNGKYPNLIKRG